METRWVILNLSVHQNQWWAYKRTRLYLLKIQNQYVHSKISWPRFGKICRNTKVHTHVICKIYKWLIGSHSFWTKDEKKSEMSLIGYEWSYSIWSEQLLLVRIRGCLSQISLPPPLLEFPLCIVLLESCSLILASLQKLQLPSPQLFCLKRNETRFANGIQWAVWMLQAHPILLHLPGKSVQKQNCCLRNCHQQ